MVTVEVISLLCWIWLSCSAVMLLGSGGVDSDGVMKKKAESLSEQL